MSLFRLQFVSRFMLALASGVRDAVAGMVRVRARVGVGVVGLGLGWCRYV